MGFWLEAWLSGGVLLQFHHFFDVSDGTLVRKMRQSSRLGKQLDQLTDHVVRLTGFVSLSWAADVPAWTGIALVATIYFDMAVIHWYVLPFMRNKGLMRSRWKQHLLQRGIIPGFAIFTAFLVISVSTIVGRPEVAVYVIIIGKNLDWLYRVWECLHTARVLRQQGTISKR